MHRSILIAILGWILACFGSLAWNLKVATRNQISLARQAATSIVQQLHFMRAWNMSHGRVYGPVTKNHQPSPFLPDKDKVVQTNDGLKLTKISSAIMIRQLAAIAEKTTGVKFRNSSSAPVNPENMVKDWEIEAVKNIEAGKKEFYYLFDGPDHKKEFRFMVPSIAKKPCLECHSKFGQKEGDLLGVFSVAVPLVLDELNLEIWISHIIALFAGLTGLTIFDANIKKNTKTLLESNLKLEKSSNELLNINREMEKDLMVAEELQKELFKVGPIPDFINLESICIPFSHVSGDIFRACKKTESLFSIFLGDGTGHGIAAAFTTIIAKMGLDEKFSETCPVKLLEHLNDIFLKLLPSERYMSAIHATIDQNGLLTVVNAGHPQMLLLKKSGELVSMKTGGLLLGLFENEILELEKETIQLEPGEKFFLFTDGLLERTNPEGKMYGIEKFQTVITENKDKNIRELINFFTNDIQNFTDGRAPEDDISLIVVEYKGKIQ